MTTSSNFYEEVVFQLLDTGFHALMNNFKYTKLTCPAAVVKIMLEFIWPSHVMYITYKQREILSS
jgi:hypothetical protein